jgi:N-sulfoglucosamine sulfohydrolase
MEILPDVSAPESETMNRRSFLRTAGLSAGFLTGFNACGPGRRPSGRPNIFFVISDDQSYIHAAAYGCRGLLTPNCDRIAREGVRFSSAFSSGAMCTVSRAALLTGRNIWQNREAGTHWSNFPRDLTVYPDLLERAGYHIGYTGKGWGPGEWRVTGWPRNPAGPAYNDIKLAGKPYSGLSDIDYAANFSAFLKKKQPNHPFCFWFGAYEPHSPYEEGSGLRAGKRLEDVDVPPNFQEDTPEIRGWLLDYFLEIEWMDRHLGRMLKALEDSGELDNTLIIVTGDNGSPMMRAKGNLYDLGTHVPFAAFWPGKIKPGRVVEDLIAFIDLAPTLLDAAGLQPLSEMTGRSFLNILLSDKSGRVDPSRTYVLTGHERASHERVDHLGYPMRAIRDYRHLYIWNMKPERWPRGDPRHFPALAGRSDARKRPPEELYDVTTDPACLRNLADDPALASTRDRLRAELEQQLTAQKDPRMLDYGDIWESYPRYGPFKDFIEGFKEQGKYNPRYQVSPRD